MTTTEHEQALIDELYADFERLELRPLWTQTADLMPARPTPRAVPWRWRASDLLPVADRAGELITIERGGERRAIALANPGLGGRPFATPTLWGALQHLGPHESAPAHRHVANAIRFVLEGEGVWTTVDGDACDMHPGDLVLTPAWTFHDHTNSTDSPMRWFDGLDLPLANQLDVIFYENHPELAQAVVDRNRSQRSWGHPGLRVRDEVPPTGHSALLRYPWSETDAALKHALADREVATVDFVDPATGGPVLSTLGCSVTRLQPGGRTPTQRRVGSSIIVVFRGSGETTLDGQRYEWGPFDMMAVPSWCEVSHHALEEADLFVLDDEPVMRALGYARAETEEIQ